MMTLLTDELEKAADFVKCDQGQIRMDLMGTSISKEQAYLLYLRPIRVLLYTIQLALLKCNLDLKTSLQQLTFLRHSLLK